MVVALTVGGPAPHFQFRAHGRRQTAMPNTMPSCIELRTLTRCSGRSEQHHNKYIDVGRLWHLLAWVRAIWGPMVAQFGRILAILCRLQRRGQRLHPTPFGTSQTCGGRGPPSLKRRFLRRVRRRTPCAGKARAPSTRVSCSRVEWSASCEHREIG